MAWPFDRAGQRFLRVNPSLDLYEGQHCRGCYAVAMTSRIAGGILNLGWLGRLDVPARYRRWVPQWLTSILVGLAASVFASLARATLVLVWPSLPAFTLLLPAMLLATLFGRWQAGLTCLAAGGLYTWYFILPPPYSFAIPDSQTSTRLISVAMVGFLLLGVGEAFRRSERRLAAERRRADAAEARRQRLLAHELNHRIKNTLATVQAIAAQTLDGAVAPEARRAFDNRLKALARAHELLTRESWTSVPLVELVTTALLPFADGHSVRIEGPVLALPSRQAIALSLGLHELATNAIKYGALSKPGGSVDIGWGLDGETFRMSWIEKDGPPVLPPTATGFGTRLLERALASEIGGKVRLDYRSNGLQCDIEGRVANADEETGEG